MRALVLTGPPGAGKSTTLTALMGRLEAEGRRCAALELESLALVHPWPDDDAAFDHLEWLAGSFRRREYPVLLLAATVTGGPYLDRVRAALPTDDVLVVRLSAPDEVLRARIVAREPPAWVGLPRLLAAVPDVARAIAGLPGVDATLDSELLSPDELATHIRERLLEP